MIKPDDRSLILAAPKVIQMIRRMAYEIYEINFKEKSIVLAGITGQGYLLAQLIASELEMISPISVQLVLITLDKELPQQGEPLLDCDEKDLARKPIILIDDVLNTGRTLTYAMKPFLKIEVRKIEVAVLVNRRHTSFPILPQYTGYELSTTLTDHVEVKLGEETAVYVH